jgi:hypothetical protein
MILRSHGSWSLPGLISGQCGPVFEGMGHPGAARWCALWGIGAAHGLNVRAPWAGGFA